MSNYLIYGANGYTGALTARLALGHGHRPILAGRNREAVAALAHELKLEHRAFGLDDAKAVDAGMQGITTVLHCAGPFAHTWKAMSDACLRNKVHYLDVTGEVLVFESLAARDVEAKAAGIMLMPGVGFDVVPSDCLAAHLKRRLPTATHLTLAFSGSGRFSRGTATTMTENIHRGGLVRRDGVLTPVPAAWKSRLIDFGAGPISTMTIPWGDLSTAFHSTGIPNIEVYMAAPPRLQKMAKLSRYFGWFLGSSFMQKRMKRKIQAGPPGPTDEERARGRSLLWGEAIDAAGNRVESRLRGPEGYTLTALTALAVIDRVLAGQAPAGFQTPAKVYGPDFVLEVPGVTREDVTV